MVVRFHSLKSPTTQEAVIPWKLDLDVKELAVHQAFLNLVHSSVWQRSGMPATDWAHLRAPFSEVIVRGMGQPIDLKHHPLMQTGLLQWQQLRKGGQQDHSDFLAFLLGWMGTNKVTHSYERRYMRLQPGFTHCRKRMAKLTTYCSRTYGNTYPAPP